MLKPSTTLLIIINLFEKCQTLNCSSDSLFPDATWCWPPTVSLSSCHVAVAPLEGRRSPVRLSHRSRLIALRACEWAGSPSLKLSRWSAFPLWPITSQPEVQYHLFLLSKTPTHGWLSWHRLLTGGYCIAEFPQTWDLKRTPLLLPGSLGWKCLVARLYQHFQSWINYLITNQSSNGGAVLLWRTVLPCIKGEEAHFDFTK